MNFFIHETVDSDPRILAMARRADKWFQEKKYVDGYSILNEYRPVLAAWDGKTPAGIIVYREGSKDLELEIIYVAYKYRGKGLLRKMIERLPGGNKPCVWACHRTNRLALDSYLRLGARMELGSNDQIICTYSRKR